jgi:hypothetical protein
MSTILHPLVKPGNEGTLVANGDGLVFRGHTLYACFIGDYPEQVQGTCVISGECPGCPTPHDQLGELNLASATDSWREVTPILTALGKIKRDPVGYQKLAKKLRVKPVAEPFWKDLPFADVYQSITPDILHQQYQGIVKHMVS